MIAFPAAIPWKLIAGATFAVALALFGWRVSVWRQSHTVFLPKANQALAAELACEEGSNCRLRQIEAQAKAETAAAVAIQDYEEELNALRNRPIPARATRLRCTASDAGVPVPGPPGSADGASPANGVVSGSDGRDIDVTALYSLAREADEVAAQLRGLQIWNKALAAPLDTRDQKP